MDKLSWDDTVVANHDLTIVASSDDEEPSQDIPPDEVPLDEERVELKRWALQRRYDSTSTGKRAAPSEDCYTFQCTLSGNDLVIVDKFLCPGYDTEDCHESAISVPMRSGDILAYTVSFWALGLSRSPFQTGFNRASAMTRADIVSALNFAHFLGVPRQKLIEEAAATNKRAPFDLLNERLPPDVIADMAATYLGADATLTERALEVTHVSVWPLMMSRVKNATVCLYRCERFQCSGQDDNRDPDFIYGMVGLAAVLAHANDMKEATLHVRACTCAKDRVRDYRGLAGYLDKVPEGVVRLTLHNLYLGDLESGRGEGEEVRVCPGLREVTTTGCRVTIRDPKNWGLRSELAPPALDVEAFKRKRVVAAVPGEGE